MRLVPPAGCHGLFVKSFPAGSSHFNRPNDTQFGDLLPWL